MWTLHNFGLEDVIRLWSKSFSFNSFVPFGGFPIMRQDTDDLGIKK